MFSTGNDALNKLYRVSFQAMLSQVNDTIHSRSLPFQRCLIPDIPEDAQHTARDVTNYIVVPLNMLVAFLSLLSNSLVVTAVIRTRSLQHPSLLLLCSLSITDLLWALFSIVRDTVRYTSEGLCVPQSEEEPWFASMCMIATVGNLAIISVDRYLAVSKPWWYRSNVKRSRVFKQASAVWLYSLMSSGFVYANEHSLIPDIVPLLAGSLFYVFSIVIIISSYIGIFVANTRHKRTMHHHAQGGQMLATLKREKKLANTVGLILLVLLLTFLPALIFPVILLILGFTNSNFSPWRPFYSFFITLNGLLNPLLNYGRNEDVRKAVRGLIRCPQWSTRVVPYSTGQTDQAHSSSDAAGIERK